MVAPLRAIIGHAYDDDCVAIEGRLSSGRDLQHHDRAVIRRLPSIADEAVGRRHQAVGDLVRRALGHEAQDLPQALGTERLAAIG